MSNLSRLSGPTARACATALAVSLVLLACADAPKQISRVQTNLVDKSIFEGEWWYTSTTIDVDYDETFVFNSANANAPFSGSMSTDYGLDYNRGGPAVLGEPAYSFPIARIRWVIDENYLFAYRSYELVSGGNDDGRSADFRGQPLAVFKIEAHVDTRKDYSPITGEATNVTIENTTDRRWFERKFMRVDWSQNLLTQFSANDVESNALFTQFQRESVPFFIQTGSHSDFPASYQPQFIRVKDDAHYDRIAEWPKDSADVVHYMSFVTQEVWSPGASCAQQGGGICASATATMRNAFLRVPPKHEYAAHTQTNDEFDKFGLFRSHQPTYARGGQDVSVQRQHCVADSDCGVGGACDNAARRAAECSAAGQADTCRAEQNVCVGGLTEDLGKTDFLSFYASRLNFFDDALSDKSCAQDWECDGRYVSCAADDDACRANQSSICDPAAHRCTTPVSMRKVHPLTFHLSPHFPPYLVRRAFDAVAQWNEAFMRAQRAAQSVLPFDQATCKGNEVCTTNLAQQGRVTCQRNDPTAFCYCGSPDDKGGTCRRDYDPFETPDEAQGRGVPSPYDCYVDGPKDLDHPEDYTQYDASAYSYKFVGSECMLKLTSNACDIDPKQPCEDLGDLRYHFLTHIQHGGANFGGIAQPLSDPTNGELITTSATVAAETLENVGTLASQFFPVLRGDASEDSYFTGENLRGYFAALGKVDHPVATVPATQAGNEGGDASRPTRVDDMNARLDKMFAKAAKLKGAEGRAAIFSDRKAALKGSSIDRQLSQALAAELPTPSDDGSQQVASSDGTPPTATASNTLPGAQTFSLDAAQQELDRERQRQLAMGTRNMDVFDDQLFNSQYWRYYATAFKGRSPAEASLRMQQAQFRGIALHEIGHVLGLRHNFAGSLDRNNYHDGYFALATQTPLPNYYEYDDPAHGGNNDGATTGAEAQRFARELTAAREERLNEGAGTVSTASIMDYNGDLSDYAGLGRYDRAAVMFSYFDKVEAYETSDPTVDPSQSTTQTPPRAFIGLERPDLYRRELWSYYRGGDSCSSDADCPHRAGRESTTYQIVSQRCVANPRLPASSGAACGSKSAQCVCSNFYDDFDAYVAGSAYRSLSRQPDFAPVKYLFCHDNRVGDLSWCTRSDAGESFQEVIEHYRRSWRERYPRAYFRNFRASGPSKGSSYSNVVDAVKIYQHMFFRSNFEGQAYRQDLSPLGFQDQYAASAAALDWLGEIIGAPDIGSYKLDAKDKVYRKLSAAPGAPGADLSLSVGQGYYLWSEYQSGLNGFFRLERAGTFLDKLLAIQAITKRDWGLTYQVDEFYYVNFYDAFQEEVVDMFGGMIMRNSRAYAPRVAHDATGDRVEYISTFRQGSRGNQDETYPAPAIDGTDTETLRDVASINALSEFPVFYDTSFEQRMLVFKLGSGDGYKIPDTRSDGSPICKYGDAKCDTPDYIVYDSDRLHTSYVAVVIDSETGKVDEQQVAFQLLRGLADRQARIRELGQKGTLSDDETDELTRIKADLVRDESYIEYLIELERQLGISSYFF
jgi:hypothetical protein